MPARVNVSAHVGKVLILLAVMQPGAAMGQNFGKSLVFDGEDDFASVPHQPELSFASEDPFTIEMWLKPTDTPDIWHALGKRSGCGAAGNHYQFARDPGSLVSFGGTGCGLGSGQDLPLDTWSHLAVTSDGTTTRLYINGQIVNQKDCTVGAQNTEPLSIGASGSCPQRFPGEIDEVRIWNVARTEFEVNEFQGCALLIDPEGLIGYWKFDEPETDQQIVDSSNSGFNGTLGVDANVGPDDPVRIVSNVPVRCAFLKDGFEAIEIAGTR
jgi:hypothetical protein